MRRSFKVSKSYTEHIFLFSVPFFFQHVSHCISLAFIPALFNTGKERIYLSHRIKKRERERERERERRENAKSIGDAKASLKNCAKRKLDYSRGIISVSLGGALAVFLIIELNHRFVASR